MTSPDEDVLNEIQMQKTHDLYCPNCIHKVTQTAKFFQKGEATFPYNKEKFILGFVIVISFKYPFIYLPWLYNNTSDCSEPTQRVVDETPRKHVLDWLWLLLVVVLLLLLVTVLWVLLSPTRSWPLSPPLPSSHINGNLTIFIPDPSKIQEDATKIHDHLKPHVYDVVEEDVTEIEDCLKPNNVVDGRPIMPAPPPHTDGSLAISEDVTEIHNHLKPHGLDVLEEDRPIQTSPPSPPLPLPLPPLPPRTNESLTTLIPEDVTEISGRVKPPVLDVVEDNTRILPSLPLPPSSPHTNISSTILIPDQQNVQEDVTVIRTCLKPHEPDVVEEAKPIQPSLSPPPPPLHDNGRLAAITPDPPKIVDATEIHGHLKPHITAVVEDDRHVSPSSTPSLPPPTSSASTNESLTGLVLDPQKVLEDITEIHGRPDPQIVDGVEEDRHISPSLPSSLPKPQPSLHTNESLKTLIPDHQKIQEDATYTHGHLKPHEPDAVEEARPIQPSLPPPIPPPPPYTNRRLAILIPDPPQIEDATKIHGHLNPHITAVVEDNSHISPSSPPSLPPPPSSPSTNGSLTVFVPDPQKVLEDITQTHGRQNPHIVKTVEEDRPISPSPPSPLPTPQTSPHTNESLIPDHQKPHAPDVVEDDSHSLPSSTPSLPLPPPSTNGSLTVLVSDPQKVLEDITEIHDRLNPHILDVVEEDRPISASSPLPLPTTQPPSHTNESSTILIPDQQKLQEDVTDIHGRLKPHVPDVVEEDRLILPSQPHTNGSLNILVPDQHQKDVTDIHGHLKPQVPDVVEDDRPILSSQPHINGSSTILTPDQQKLQEDFTEIHGHLNSHVTDVIEDDIHNTSSLPPPSSHTNGSLTVLISGLQNIPEAATEIDGRLKSHGPDVIEDDIHNTSSSPPLLPTPHINESLTILISNPQNFSEDVTKIHDRLKPHVPNVVEDDRPIPPSPPPIKRKGGWLLVVISLLLLIILALCLLSISWKRRTKTKNVVAKVDVSYGEAQDSTHKPEDITGVENNEDATSQSDDLSTTEQNANGSGTETGTSPPTTLAKVLGILWKHIVVQVLNILQTELDIVKSIVYGGLIESITSFGVVSSAAASGTSTLNVLALALANLFSGLLLIIYNLYGLVMSEPFYQSANIDHTADVKATDPYEELLGSRKKVILHCVVVVVSFIFFGVIPPLFYGFSFKITDNGHYEAAVFAAGSLVCVMSLSFAKAYAFGMDKLKTMAVYTGIAVGASAFSFIASQHVKDLFEKYDFHKLASDYLKG